MAFEDPIEKESFSLVVDRSRAYGWCLRENADATALGSNEAAQFVLNRFLDAYDRLKDAELPW